MLSDLGNSHVLVDGQFVSADIERVVLAIKEYEPRLDVKWVPPAARTEGVAAFKIIYHDPSGHDFTLFHVNTEEEFDIRVLQRIIVNDQRNGEAKYSEVEAFEEAAKRVSHQKFLDEMEEANDVAAHILRTPKNTYKVSDDLVIKEGIPFNAAPKIMKRRGLA